LDGIEYKDGKPDQFLHSEGSVRMDENGQFHHYFVLRDHLGNTRVTFSDLNNDDEINEKEEMIQINNYYAFGLNMEGNWNGKDGANKYQYNGKEWNDDFGLGWNDYGRRFYDPAVGRFFTKDRFAEKYLNFTPYQYGANNPMNYIDINGDSLKLNPVRTDVQENYHNVSMEEGKQAIEGFKTICNNKLGNKGSVTVDANGIVSLKIDPNATLSSQQQAFVDALNKADAGNVVLNVAYNSDCILFGRFADQAIDVADMLIFGESGKMTASSLLAHEIAEQTAFQQSRSFFENCTKGDFVSDYFKQCHKIGVTVENLVGNATNLDKVSTQLDPNRPDLFQFTGEMTKEFKKNGTIYGVSFELLNNNVKKVISN
jgi:RHS repeat-associated protein